MFYPTPSSYQYSFGIYRTSTQTNVKVIHFTCLVYGTVSCYNFFDGIKKPMKFAFNIQKNFILDWTLWLWCCSIGLRF